MEVDTAEDALRSSPVQHASDQSTGAPAGIRKQLLVACKGHSMHSSSDPEMKVWTCSTCKMETTQMHGLMMQPCACG